MWLSFWGRFDLGPIWLEADLNWGRFDWSQFDLGPIWLEIKKTTRSAPHFLGGLLNSTFFAIIARVKVYKWAPEG